MKKIKNTHSYIYACNSLIVLLLMTSCSIFKEIVKENIVESITDSKTGTPVFIREYDTKPYQINIGEIIKARKEQKKKQSGEKDTKLTKWLGKFERSWNYAKQNYHQKWENNWKLYRNIRVKRSHDGVVQTFVPMVNSAVNTIVAELFNSNPLVNYVPNHPDQEADTKVLNEIYADFALRDNWVQKNKVNGRQGLITGNFCAFYEWIEDRDGGYVHKINIPIRDMIIDPSSSSYEDWKYVGRRFFADKKSLEEETIYDFKTDSYKKRYKNLDEVISGGKDEDDDKSKKDQTIGSIDNDKDRVELIEIWTKKYVVVIANRNVKIHITLWLNLNKHREKPKRS